MPHKSKRHNSSLECTAQGSGPAGCRATETEGSLPLWLGVWVLCVCAMIHVRQNIVNRHPKPPTISNSENVDKEFDEQMRSLEMKQKHYAWKEAEVRQAVSPQRQETLRRQADLKEAMEEQLRFRESERRRLTEEQQKFDRYNEYLRKFSGPHSVEEEMAREQNRKEYLRGLMDDNIRLSTLKKEIQEKEKQLEAEMDRIRATMPCTWNRRHYL